MLPRHPESLAGAVLLAAMVPFAADVEVLAFPGGHTIDAARLPIIKKFIDAGWQSRRG